MTTRTRVKICGITAVEDAKHVVQSGADAIGLVFYPPSPRHVELRQAADIARSIPAFVTRTALFVNPDPAHVNEVLSQVAIDLLQFHGDESPEFCQQFGRPYIKAIRMRSGIDLKRVCEEYQQASGLLLDAYVPGVPGGTGEAFNWSMIPDNLALPVILAGGLNADNVKSAIEVARPYAVDVSGGVEQSKGVKSPVKVKTFMQRVMSTVE